MILVRHNDKPWISSELKKEIRKRDRLRQNFLRLKTRSTELKYKCQRNKVNNIKKNSAKCLTSKKLANRFLTSRQQIQKCIGGPSSNC